jgi:disulfide bond formation protein DsbB
MIITPEKEALLTFLNHYLACATLIGLIISILWLISLMLVWSGVWNGGRKVFESIAEYILPLGFFATLFSTIMSLVYSDYLGVLPCGLCWYQRVFIYGMVFLFGMAWYKRDTKILDYVMLFSGVGLIIALYHQSLQMGYSELIPCPAIASTIDCAKPTFVEYGFITFPMMAVVLFCFTILLALTFKVTVRK